MTLSVISWSPQVIKIFSPNTFQVPSPRGSALETIAAKSEPAFGSVKFIVPVHSPEIIFGKYISLISLEAAIVNASIAPLVSIGHKEKAWLAAFHISFKPVATTIGCPKPPNSISPTTLLKPCSQNFL